jgi:aminoglycoside phosphotransferase family enzyme/predicted kinase
MSGPPAGVAESHTATIFLAGDRAYKLKKPVSLGFLDFTTVAARAEACRRETELNRRFSPDVYLGVAEVRNPDGQVCDHLVVMRRMPSARRLSAMVTAGGPVTGPVRQVARILAAQHAGSARQPEIDAEGSRDALRGRWRDSFAQVRELGGGLSGWPELGEAEDRVDRFLAGRQPVFERRVADGRIVDGHGDLLADDIFALDDGPRILDCLEFDDRLRWLDGLDDAAFLAMDLERLGATGLAQQFLRWYAEFAADPAPSALSHHYVAYRSFVRAKVADIRARQGAAPMAAQARQLAQLALRHLRAGAVALVLVGGLPGTGKSALSAELADTLGMVVLSSDRIRKELAGLPPEEHFPTAYGTGLYTEAWTTRTYDEMLSRAARLLAEGESVILDASWTSAPWRARARSAAAAGCADLVQLCCSAPEDVVRQRLRSRTAGLSDADEIIAARIAAGHPAWPEAMVVDTSRGDITGSPDQPGEATRRAMSLIRPHGSEHVWPARPYLLPD